MIAKWLRINKPSVSKKETVEAAHKLVIKAPILTAF